MSESLTKRVESATQQIESAGKVFAEVKCADSNTMVDTDCGQVPSLRKILKDLSGFQYLGKWLPATSYKLWDQIKTPDHDIWLCLEDHVSSVSFDHDQSTGKWSVWQSVAGSSVGYASVTEAASGRNETFEQITIIDRNGATFEKVSKELADTYPDIAKFEDAGAQWWGLRLLSKVSFNHLIKNNLDRSEMDQAVTFLNMKLQDGMLIDLAGEYIWPTVSFTTNGKNNVIFKNGSIVRKDNTGTEYLIWIADSDGCSVRNMHFDGGVNVIPKWGQQCVYVRQSTNIRITENYFKNIGDAPIRYARSISSSDSDRVTTNGLIISDNVFSNCTQVTSNNTGALNVVISNNIFKKTAIKITQRTPLEGDANTLITGNVWGEMGYADGSGQNCISIQGGNNVVIESNSFVQESPATVLEFYGNSSSFAPDGSGIPYKDIFFKNNNIQLLAASRAITGFNGTDGNGNAIDSSNSVIEVSGNNFDIGIEMKGSPSDPSENTLIYVANTGSDQSVRLCTDFIVRGNKVTGNMVPYLLSTGTQTGCFVRDSVWRICENTGVFEYSILGGIPKIREGGELYICDNEIMAPGICTASWSTGHDTKAIVDISRNTLYITDKSDLPDFTACVNNNGLRVSKQVYSENKFIRHGTDTARYCYWFFGYDANMTIATTFVCTNNQFLIKGEYTDYQMRPLYCNSVGGGIQYTNLLAADNWYLSDNPAKSDNSAVTVEDLVFRNAEIQQARYIIKRGVETKDYDSTAWRKWEEWNDGAYRQWGREKKVYDSPYSGNTYLAIHALNDQYTVRLTVEAETPAVISLKGRSTNAFQTYAVNLSNPSKETFPYFHYELEYNKNDSVG